MKVPLNFSMAAIFDDTTMLKKADLPGESQINLTFDTAQPFKNWLKVRMTHRRSDNAGVARAVGSARRRCVDRTFHSFGSTGRRRKARSSSNRLGDHDVL